MATPLFTSSDRKLLWSIPVIGACLFSVAASFSFVFASMSTTFAATPSQQELMRSALSVGALLAVFPAGVLGARLGERRLIIWCAGIFTLGAATLLITPIVQLAFAGLAFAGAGRVGMFIAALSLMTKIFTTKDRRAVGISRLSMAIPVAALVMPVLAGVLVERVGWRAVAAVWVLLGVTALVLALKWLPATSPQAAPGEMLTPSLAALALTAGVQWLSFVWQDGFASVRTLVLLAVFIASSVGLLLALRITAHPSMDVAALRSRGVLLFAAVVLLLGVTNLSFVISVALQKLYAFSAMSTAFMMLPAQAAALVGALVAAKLIRRTSIRIAGISLLLGLTVSLFACVALTTSTPVFVPILIVSGYSLFLIGAGVPVANAIMNSAKKGSEDAVAAYRSAASNLGAALGVAVFTILSYGAVTQSFTASQVAAGYEEGSMAFTTNAEIASALYLGDTDALADAEEGASAEQIDSATQSEITTLVAAVRSQGILGGTATVIAIGIFAYGTRRHGSMPDTAR